MSASEYPWEQNGILAMINVMWIASINPEAQGEHLTIPTSCRAA